MSYTEIIGQLEEILRRAERLLQLDVITQKDKHGILVLIQLCAKRTYCSYKCTKLAEIVSVWENESMTPETQSDVIVELTNIASMTKYHLDRSYESRRMEQLD